MELEKKPCHLISQKTELAEVSQVFTVDLLQTDDKKARSVLLA